jgi:hypothetical protein
MSAARSWSAVITEHARVVAQLEPLAPVLDRMAEALIAALRGGRRVYILGNGGSAADAQHIAAELLGRFKRDRRALPAIALTTDSSCLTAIGNDLGFECVCAEHEWEFAERACGGADRFAARRGDDRLYGFIRRRAGGAVYPPAASAARCIRSHSGMSRAGISLPLRARRGGTRVA